MATERTGLLSMQYDIPNVISSKLYTDECIVVMPKQIQIIQTTDDGYGLTLEQLLPYQDDPWWQYMRRILMTTIWLTFIALLLTACILSFNAFHQQHCLIKNTKQLQQQLRTIGTIALKTNLSMFNSDGDAINTLANSNYFNLSSNNA